MVILFLFEYVKNIIFYRTGILFNEMLVFIGFYAKSPIMFEKVLFSGTKLSDFMGLSPDNAKTAFE